MNAHKFVAEKGIDEAKRVLEGAPDWACYYSTIDGEYYLIELDAVNLRKLKQVVESVDLIESYGGITKAKVYMTRYFKLNGAFRKDYPKTGIFITQQMSALQNAIAHAEK